MSYDMAHTSVRKGHISLAGHPRALICLPPRQPIECGRARPPSQPAQWQSIDLVAATAANATAAPTFDWLQSSQLAPSERKRANGGLDGDNDEISRKVI